MTSSNCLGLCHAPELVSCNVRSWIILSLVMIVAGSICKVNQAFCSKRQHTKTTASYAELKQSGMSLYVANVTLRRKILFPAYLHSRAASYLSTYVPISIRYQTNILTTGGLPYPRYCTANCICKSFYYVPM